MTVIIQPNRVLRYDVDKMMEVLDKPISKFRPFALITVYSGYSYGRPRFDVHIVNIDLEISSIKKTGELRKHIKDSRLWYLKSYNGDYYDYKNYIDIEIRNHI